MSTKQRICGNCFSPIKNGVCRECGYRSEYVGIEYDALETGFILNDRYVVGRLIGRGGFGLIYLAYDEKNEKTVAIKEYYPDGLAERASDNITVEPLTSFQSEDYSIGLERFLKESEMIMQLRNSSDILGVYDVFSANGTAYYAMDYFKGISLNDYVKHCGAISVGQAIYIAERLLPALSDIHSQKMIHRDVSPDNIMLCENGKVMLIDFGSARSISNDKQNYSVTLKVGFAPLEQYQRNGNQGGWTDLYSLGTSLFFSTTLHIPEDPMTRLDSDSAFSKELSKLPNEFSRIIKKASEVKIENRYSRAEDMLYDISQCGIEPEPVNIDDKIIENAELPRPATQKLRKKKKYGFIAAAAAAVLCILGIFIFRNLSESNKVIEVKIGGDIYSVETTELDLSDCELTNAQIANLQHLKDLTYLNLSDNYLTDLSCLEELENLQSLHFSNNCVNDISFMRNMKHLKKISAENNMIDDISVLRGMTELEEVFFGDNYVTDISPLSDSRGLVKVGFNEAQIGDLTALEGMEELEMVCLAGCNLYDIKPLANSHKLRFVYLGRNNLSDLSPLAGCTIEELYVDNNRLSGHTDTFSGITLNGFAAMEGNGFTEDEINNICSVLSGDFTVYY
ncbi:MAG: leucine-rich repeat domain-containing protein [Oscillospiraceae bacterium]